MTPSSEAAPAGLLPGPYADGAAPGLAEVLVPLRAAPAEDSSADVVVLIDGLGAQLLAEHRAEAPALRRLAAQTRIIRTVFPATTATALATLMTGASPLRHGIIGYRGLIGAVAGERPRPTPLVINQLTGHSGLDPADWVLATADVPAARPLVQVAPEWHRGSHLSRALYPDFTMRTYRRRDERVDAVVAAVRGPHADGRGPLVYVHLDEVDHAGHYYGPGSAPWREALAEVDAEVASLLRRLPRGTRLHLTADHGMVPASSGSVIDLAADTELDQHLQVVAGDPRAPQLCVRGDGAERIERSAQVAVLLAERTDGAASVVDRAGMLRGGLLGPPEDAARVDHRLQSRLGDLLVLFSGPHMLTDSRLRAPDHPPETGVHGALTAEESLVPLIRVDV